MPTSLSSKARRQNSSREIGRRCCKQPGQKHPCTCAMGNVSRFIEPVVLRILKEKKKSYGYEIAECLAQYALTDATIEGAALYRTLFDTVRSCAFARLVPSSGIAWAGND